MLRLAICDDNEAELDKLYSAASACNASIGINADIDIYRNGNELVDAVRSGTVYDLMVLDIVMPELLGTDAARQIYDISPDVQFIFLTSSRDYAVESYEVDALDYIIKPVTEDRLERAFAKYFKLKKDKMHGEIIINSTGQIAGIDINAVCYVESMSHLLSYKLSDGETVSYRQNLTELEPILLKYSNFIKPHRSYIVNMDYIGKIEKNCITMKSGEQISISRGKLKEIPALFLKYKLKEGGR